MFRTSRWSSGFVPNSEGAHPPGADDRRGTACRIPTLGCRRTWPHQGHQAGPGQPWVLTPSLAARPEPSADLLRQLDDDPLRAADVAEQIDVLVVHHLADELTAVGSQAGEGGLDAVDGEGEVAEARGVRRRVRVAVLEWRRVELDQLEPAMAVRGLHEREL